MLNVLLTFADGSTSVVNIHSSSQFMDIAEFHDAESAEILSYVPA